MDDDDHPSEAINFTFKPNNNYSVFTVPYVPEWILAHPSQRQSLESPASNSHHR